MKTLLALALLSLGLLVQGRFLGNDAVDIDDVMLLPVRSQGDDLTQERGLDEFDSSDEVDILRRQLQPYYRNGAGGLRYNWNGGRTSFGVNTRLFPLYTPNVNADFMHRFRNGVKVNVGGGYIPSSRRWNAGAKVTIPLRWRRG